MRFDPNDSRITAYAMGELTGDDLSQFERELEQSPELQKAVEETLELTAQLASEWSSPVSGDPSPSQRETTRDETTRDEATLDASAVNRPQTRLDEPLRDQVLAMMQQADTPEQTDLDVEPTNGESREPLSTDAAGGPPQTATGSMNIWQIAAGMLACAVAGALLSWSLGHGPQRGDGTQTADQLEQGTMVAGDVEDSAMPNSQVNANSQGKTPPSHDTSSLGNSRKSEAGTSSNQLPENDSAGVQSLPESGSPHASTHVDNRNESPRADAATRDRHANADQAASGEAIAESDPFIGGVGGGGRYMPTSPAEANDPVLRGRQFPSLPQSSAGVPSGRGGVLSRSMTQGRAPATAGRSGAAPYGQANDGRLTGVPAPPAYGGDPGSGNSGSGTSGGGGQGYGASEFGASGFGTAGGISGDGKSATSSRYGILGTNPRNGRPANRSRAANRSWAAMGEGRGNAMPNGSPTKDLDTGFLQSGFGGGIPQFGGFQGTAAIDQAATEMGFRIDDNSGLDRSFVRSPDEALAITENHFLSPWTAPTSTFSVDVDTAAYAKARLFLEQRMQMPPRHLIRVEELVNAFSYNYAGPEGDQPFSSHLSISECPWQPKHRLVRVALQARRPDRERQPSNLVFLIDVSGSMDEANKLPLLKRSLGFLIDQLREDDRVSIVVYSGEARVVLPSVSGNQFDVVRAAVDMLRAEGSTNGSGGLELAYGIALDNFRPKGTNRIILCTDGDFNVGKTSTAEVVNLAKGYAQNGIQISVLGFGFDDHNDELLEALSNQADGNYAFVDSLAEARRALGAELAGTLDVVAKDVKLQVEFNPGRVESYRLIGYENRALAHEDFDNDAKDAGDIGVGQSVTALYEVVPVNEPGDEIIKERAEVLKYQRKLASNDSKDILTLSVRYKPPGEAESRRLSFALQDDPVRFGQMDADFRFAAAVASFGMLLRGSTYAGDSNFAAVAEIALESVGSDTDERRQEFVTLVKRAQRFSGPE